MNQELTKLSTDYLNLSIEKKLEELDDYVKKVKSGEIEYQSSLFNKYYLDEVLLPKCLYYLDKHNSKQIIRNKDEIDKRDEILTKIFIEKNKELSRLENLDVKTYNLVYDTNIDINGFSRKIRDLRIFVRYVDRILNTKVINIELESKKSIDEKIIELLQENARIQRITSNGF